MSERPRLAGRPPAQYYKGVGWTPGETVGEYRLLETLGTGGAGAVWRVEHVSTGAQRALKVMLDVDPNSLARFEREALALARLEHPNVARVHTAGEAFGRRYLVLDLAEGGDLEARLKASGPLQPEQAVALLRDLCAGLAHVHAQGVLHRDLKPSNVLFADDGRPLLVDFGLSRSVDSQSLTNTGAILGTPRYMAPEQANGEATDERTDVYGLGALFYATLTGQPPFQGGATAVLYAVLSKPPRPPQELNPAVPPELAEVCLTALAKDPNDRYPSVRAFADALAAPPLLRPNYAALGLAATSAVFALVALAVVWSVWGTQPEQPTRPARVERTEVTPPPTQPPPESALPLPFPEHLLDRKLRALGEVTVDDLADMSWNPVVGTRAELLSGTSSAPMDEACRFLSERGDRRSRRLALLLPYQVACRGALLEGEARFGSQEGWVSLARGLLSSWQLLSLDEPEWEAHGRDLVQECLRRGTLAGRSDAPAYLGELHLGQSSTLFPRDLAAAVKAFQQTLSATPCGEWDHNHAMLTLAWIAAEHPSVPGCPDDFTALSYAEHACGVYRSGDLKRAEAVEARDALQARVEQAAKTALDDTLGALPEVTLADLADYEPSKMIYPQAEGLLSLRDTNGLEDAYRWLRERGEHVKAAALLYQVAQRGLELDEAKQLLERLTTQRGWFLLGRELVEGSLHDALWSEPAWRYVGWHVITECYRRAWEGGRSDGGASLAFCYLGTCVRYGREPDPVQAQAWYRKTAGLLRCEEGDRRLSKLYLAVIALDYPQTPGRLSDEDALQAAREVQAELDPDTHSAKRAEAERVEAGLLKRIEGR